MVAFIAITIIAAVTGFLIHWWLSGLRIHMQCRRHRRRSFHPSVRKIPWRRKWQPPPVFLPGKSHGQRRLASYRPWGHKESDTTEANEQMAVVYFQLLTTSHITDDSSYMPHAVSQQPLSVLSSNCDHSTASPVLLSWAKSGHLHRPLDD